MSDMPTLHKFPAGSANRDYDVFEKFPNGSTIWRICVCGMENVELKLQEMAKGTTNKLFAINMLDGTQPTIHPSASHIRRNLRRAS
jgi:hypothetical protein